MELLPWSRCRLLIPENPDVIDLSHRVEWPQLHTISVREYYTRVTGTIWCLLILEQDESFWRLFQYADKDSLHPEIVKVPRHQRDLAQRYFPVQMMELLL